MREIIYREITELVLLEDNPRKISSEQMEKLKDSIDKNPDYFECRPVILSDRTGELVVIAGNQRVKAATAIGMKAIPTILLTGLTEEREKEIIIRDNVNNGEWDEELLAEWDAALLDDWGVELPVFDLISLQDLNLDKPNRLQGDEFSVTFCFSKQFKEAFDTYFKENGKNNIVKLIIDTICQDAEVK